MLASTVGLFGAALLSLGSVSAQDGGQPTRSQIIFLSHLSPLLDYSPLSPTDDPDAGWNVSLARHATNHSGASLTLSSFFLNNLEVPGNASRIGVEFESLGDDDEDATSVSITQIGPRIFGVRRSAFAEPDTNVYNITVSTTAEGSFMELDRITLYSTLPGDM